MSRFAWWSSITVHSIKARWSCSLGPTAWKAAGGIAPVKARAKRRTMSSATIGLLSALTPGFCGSFSSGWREMRPLGIYTGITVEFRPLGPKFLDSVGGHTLEVIDFPSVKLP